ncbi:glycoside hydrolase family 97 protein [Mucilaginibacter ginsenosidivorans]|uniref:Glycoside hydrolase family 97 protein n=1 Tax=Mucilaginibacter ginsenosidivorans TaxID=398053 RepID=A0A5B8UYS9_9SPHI|nr:glycoside hydrolase family 97 protein [Mucilaginibacter ginsenosidivorans]QEC64108.1 glycoside hydrolase family 97 protein [Mucilaginibacter ginsenosidivorans]
MKLITTFLLSLSLVYNVQSQDNKSLKTSLEKVSLEFSLNNEGRPLYSVYYADKIVIKPSALGFTLADNSAFDKNFEITGSETSSFDDTWKPVWGEVSSIRNHYNQLTIHLKQKGSNKLMNIIFRVFADGIGFRYEFPRQTGLKYFIVSNELTSFNMAGDHKTFWIPGDYDSNEYLYTTSKLSEIDNKPVVDAATSIAVRVAPDRYAVQTPLMMKSADGLYINIHEAALIDFPAMQLHVDRSNYSLTANLVPDAVGNKAYVHAPFKTPWRTIIVSDKAADILSSKLILNLNEPSKIENTSWIKPMKFVGVWWEMQTGKSTWNYANDADTLDAYGRLIPNGRHSANTTNVKKYIDFAAANGIAGVLVEGWNTGWEDWFGNWKEHVFSFVTPYPDFDVKELSRYAASKGVNIIMHNETSGSATDYERQMDTAYRFMNKFGYTSVKTGYVGKIIPRGEHHDGQWMIEHYLRVAQKAADHHIMLDAHEPVRPTGLQRTYPNWLASEASRGNEYNAFAEGNTPEHETIMPFTRFIGGPMDYTPGIFKIKGYSNVPGRQVHTTLAKQLALYVVLYSPLQMAADLPENYAQHMDAFQFIKDVAVDWDDTKILEAEPGDYITTARKAKDTPDWYIGALIDENSRSSTISLNFLDKGTKYVATVYADADNADWKDNPEAYKITKYLVDSNTKVKLTLAKGGGAAISIKPVTTTDKGLKKYK